MLYSLPYQILVATLCVYLLALLSLPVKNSGHSSSHKLSTMLKAKRLLLMAVGWLSIALGVAGIALPILPTTPFLLLALWCFANSSEKYHNWLINHATFGPILSLWQDDNPGIPRATRNRILIILWLSLIVSMTLIAKLWAIALLSITGIGVSYFIQTKTLQD